MTNFKFKKMKKVIFFIVTLCISTFAYSQTQVKGIENLDYEKELKEQFLKANPNLTSEQVVIESQENKNKSQDCGLVWIGDNNGYSTWKATRAVCIWVNTPAPYGGITRMQVNLRKDDTVSFKINVQGYTCGCN
jgi:hypothetical protein